MTTTLPGITVTCFSPAKVNLCLRVVGQRADGYHLLDSIFAAIDFGDHLTLHCADVRADRTSRVITHCNHPAVPNDATNLAARAAITLLADCGLGADVDIVIDKKIPPGAGLGGGSSNAAAVLIALDTTLRLGVSAQRLHELALALGADVPFFLVGGCARVRGIGETIEPIAGWPGLDVLVALPPISVSTAWAFRAYHAEFSHGSDEADRMAHGRRPDATLLHNDLETAVVPAHPEIGHVKRSLLASGASAAVMSGSGAAVVGVLPPSLDARAVAAAFRERHPDVPLHCARILAAGPRPLS